MTERGRSFVYLRLLTVEDFRHHHHPFSCWLPKPPASVPKLTDMASFTVSVALWQHNITNLSSTSVAKCSPHFKQNRNSSFHVSLREKVIKLVEKLPVPVSISKRIAEYVTLIAPEFKDWISYHLEPVFHEVDSISCYAMYSLFHYIVWYPNGRIDRVQTARNLLNCPGISDVEKYRMLCMYCLKDELESIWPSLVSNGVIDRVRVTGKNHHHLIHYWNCYFGLEPGVPHNMPNKYMFEHARVDNWAAKSYFFDRLTAEEQTQITISFIDRGSAEIQRILLRKLDATQRLRVYMSKAVKMICNFATERDYEPDILSTWYKICNFITGEDFVSIYKHLSSSRTIDITILETIWSSASDDFQIHLLNYNDHEMIGCALRSWVEKSENELFFKILSESSINMKRDITTKPFFLRCILDLLRGDKLPLINRLMHFCLVKLEDRNKFKYDLTGKKFFTLHCKRLTIENKLDILDQLLNLFQIQEGNSSKFKRNLSRTVFFRQHCEKLLIDDEFQKFDLLLNSFVVEIEQLKFRQDLLTGSKLIQNYFFDCCANGEDGISRVNLLLTSLLPSSPDFIIEYKKNLLMSSYGIDWCAARIHSKIDLYPIINDALPTPDLATEFKKRLIFSPTSVNELRKWITSNRLNELDLCIHRYIISNEDEIVLKKRIIGNPVEVICEFLKLNTDETSWKSLGKWWPRDESTPIDFNSTLPLDEIFNQMLKYCIYSKYDPAHRLSYCKLRTDLRFDALDRFLKWYFKSSIKVTEYKSQRIDAYVEIDAITTLLKKRNSTNLTTVRSILNWIFENDSQKLAEFKVKQMGQKILDAIK